MIFLGKKEISSIFLRNKSVTQIYKGAILIWEAIRSCFGAGFWKNKAPWINNEGWKS